MRTTRESQQRRKTLSSLQPNERAGLTAFVEQLRLRYGDDLLRVVLFGSKARGDFDAESDVDVLVILREKDHWKSWDEITDLTSQLLLETGVNISALVCDIARYRWWADHRAPIYNSIQRDGVDLWTRASEPSSQYA